MSAAPSPLSDPILVGSESKSPYQWAAQLAPHEEGKLVQYKNAMLWLQGESFGSRDEFLAKVERIIAFQEEENHRPTATVEVPVQPAPPVDESGSDKGWTTTSAPKKAKNAPAARLTRQQLAKVIVDGCIREMKRVFTYTGPSMEISSVYPRFKKDEFTYPQLIGAIRDEIVKLQTPSQEGFPVPNSARYEAKSSAGKGQNFNFKVQRRDSSKPGGYSAVAQIHVLWE